MDINIVRTTFVFSTISVGIGGLLINFLEPYLPVFITRTYRYGKFSDNRHQFLVAKCEVPKRWYKHFYIFAGPATTLGFLLALYTYLYRGNVPEIICDMLDMLLGKSRMPLASAESTLLAVGLFAIQCWKRLYETHRVNVFSDKNMNTSHYILGFLHYGGTLIAILGESQGFVKGSHATFDWQRITYFQIACVIVFLYSSYKQFRASKILSSLRKNTDGRVVSDKYKIPAGDLFEYVSSPLQLTEIMMYITLSALLWRSSTYHFITVWVMANQTECAILNQQWYKETFKNYPNNRNILIPYVF